MGKILSLLAKPIREYNVESRAHKIISMDKPMPAPKYKSDILDYERIMKETPESFSETLKKDERLNRHLRDVFVTSHDQLPIPQAVPQNPERPLPLNTRSVEDFEFGVKEPEKVSLGKVTLRNVLKFLIDYQLKPTANGSTKIAEEYLLPEKTVSNIIKYFKLYEVYVPDIKNPKAQFIGPYVRRKGIVMEKLKELGPGKVKEDT